MKPVPTQVLAALAGRFGYTSGDLTHLGGGHESSDGIAYRAATSGKPMVFKVIGSNVNSPHAVENTTARAAFFAYLGQNGVEVVAPQLSVTGNLLETEALGDTLFMAYQYPFLTGEHPSPDHWTDEVVHAWGRTIGTAHKLCQNYPIWQGIPSGNDAYPALSWQSEIRSFIEWCGDEDVKAVWASIRDQLASMPYTREAAGFIHNDPHMQNILLDDGRIKLLDFDVACCHFFACDLAIAIQSVLFTMGGGMDRPVGDQKTIDWFVDTLIGGYTDIWTPPAQVFGSISLFIQYRRALLFTVMQDWLAHNHAAHDSWKRMILENPRVLTDNRYHL